MYICLPSLLTETVKRGELPLPPTATAPEKFSRREGVGGDASFLTPTPSRETLTQFKLTTRRAADSLRVHLSQQREQQSTLTWRLSEHLMD